MNWQKEKQWRKSCANKDETGTATRQTLDMVGTRRFSPRTVYDRVPGFMKFPMLFRIASVAIISMALHGCSKEASTPTPVESSTAAPPAAASGTAPEGTAEGGDVTATLVELTQTVRKYAAEKQRVPKDLNELVGAGYLPSVPTAPSGKRFAIDKQLQVYLANP